MNKMKDFQTSIAINCQTVVIGDFPKPSPLRRMSVRSADGKTVTNELEPEFPVDPKLRAQDFDLQGMLRDGIDLKEVDQTYFRPSRIQLKSSVESIVDNIDQARTEAEKAAAFDAIMAEIKAETPKNTNVESPKNSAE